MASNLLLIVGGGTAAGASGQRTTVPTRLSSDFPP
jgi:hypothetical protein